MRLSKQTSDAVKVLVLCARNADTLVKVASVADQIAVTKPLGLKLVNILARLGYLETVRGPNGGVRLARDPETLTLGEVVRDLEAFSMHESPMDPDPDSAAALNRSGLQEYVDDAFRAFLAVLDQQTIAALANPSGVVLGDADTAPPKPQSDAGPAKGGRGTKAGGKGTARVAIADPTRGLGR